MHILPKNFLHVATVATFVLAFFFLPAVVAADDLGQSVGSVTVPDTLKKEDVQEAIVASLTGRAWEVKEKTDERVVGYLKHRSNEATLTLVYTDKKVDLFCVGWSINSKTGERKKPELPNGWIGNIKSDLTKQLNRLTAKK